MFRAAVIVLVGAFVTVLAPGGEDDARRRGIALIVSLSVLAVLAETAVQALPSEETVQAFLAWLAPETVQAQTAAEEAKARIVRGSIERIERGAAQLIAVRCSVPADDVRVVVRYAVGDDGVVALTGAEIYIRSGAARPDSVEGFAGALLGCPCMVKEDEEGGGDVEAAVEG